MTRLRALPRLTAAGLLALLPLVLLAPAAHAETTYRYWAYVTAEDGGWATASVGADEVDPTEGSVQAMRFAVHGLDPLVPRVEPDFETVCAGTDPVPDGERVAVVVDPGTEADAPEGGTPGPLTGTCVLAAPGDTAQDVIAAAAELRSDDSGLICALDGYPAEGCGDPAPASEPTDDTPVELQVQPPVGFPAGSASTPAPEPSGGTAPGTDAGTTGSTGAITAVVAVAAVVVIGGGVAVAAARRRRQG